MLNILKTITSRIKKVNIPICIILHHSLTADGFFLYDFEAIRRYHMDVLGWRDIGYHWILEYRDGRLTWMKGREESIPGAHCKEKGMNFKSIGICIVGNFDKDTLTIEHYKMIADKISELNTKYNKKFKIYGHNEFARYKSCPGKNFDLTRVKEAVKYQKLQKDLFFLHFRKKPIIDDVEYWQKLIDNNATMSQVSVKNYISSLRKVVERI